MDLWNQKYLPAPPTNAYKSKTKDLDVVKLKNALKDCAGHFKNEDILIRETALLSRILYRMKMKFRSSKEFKALEKINHSLNIYLNANMTRDLKNVIDLLPSKYQTETYLPTRNMLSYILVRIQGLVKLMERVYDTCQVAAYDINTRMFIGHFWKNYVILFALVSRIYVLVKFNTKLLCELYGKLLPHSNKLENPGRNWLPQGYQLPSDLREWLGVNWVYEEEFIDLTQDLALNSSMKMLDFFNLVDDDDDEIQFCDEYVLIDEEDRNIARDFKKLMPIAETFTRNRMRGFSINEDDIGEDIAEIIKFNEHIEHSPENSKNNKDSYLTYTNKNIDAEDIGEEISCIGPVQIINLDETNSDWTAENNGLVKSPKKGMSRSTKSRTPIKRNTDNTIINLADDTMVKVETEVIVIPDTPFKKNGHKLDDDSLIVLDDTFSTTSALPKTKNKFALSEVLTKKRGKKRKKRNIINRNDYLITEEKLDIKQEKVNGSNEGTNYIKFEKCEEINPNISSNSLTSQDILCKKETETWEYKTTRENNKVDVKTEDNGEHSTGNNTTTSNDSNTQQIIKKPETKMYGLLRVKDISKMKDSNNLGNNYKTIRKRKNKKPTKAEIKKAKQIELERGQEKERRKFDGLLLNIGKFLRGEIREVPEDIQEVPEEIQEVPEVEKKHKKKGLVEVAEDKVSNVVCLSLVKDIPKKENLNERDRHAPNNNKSTKVMNLVPRLETPIKATLNIDKLVKASKSGETCEQRNYNIQLNRLGGKMVKIKDRMNESPGKSGEICEQRNYNIQLNRLGGKIVKIKDRMNESPGKKSTQMTQKGKIQENQLVDSALSHVLEERPTVNMSIKEEIPRGTNREKSESNIPIELSKKRFKEKSRNPRFEVSSSTRVTTLDNKELKANNDEPKRNKNDKAEKYQEPDRSLVEKKKSEEDRSMMEKLVSMPVHMLQNTEPTNKSEFKKKKNRKRKSKSLLNMSDISEMEKSKVYVGEPHNDISVEMLQNKKRKLEGSNSNMPIDISRKKHSKKNDSQKKLEKPSPSNMFVQTRINQEHQH